MGFQKFPLLVFPPSSRSYQMMNLLLYKLFNVITETSALFELNGLFLSHSAVIKENDGEIYPVRVILIKWRKVMMDVFMSSRFWKNTAKAGYVGLNCHKQHQWDVGSSEMPSAGFWQDCSEGQVTTEVSFWLGSEQAPLYSAWERHDSIEEKTKSSGELETSFPRTK